MAAAEYVWPRRSSITRSPDTLSPVYPDRPIRPLPKNRLREQLSPEQQKQITYPPIPPSTSPLFSFPYGVVEKIDPRALNHHESHSHCTCNGDHHVDESEDDEELIAYDHPSYRWSSPVNDGSRVDSVQRKLMAAKVPPAPASTASSADGYESFENTSNKKKRKIPLSGGGSAHQSSLSQELANMGISSREDQQQDSRQLSGSGRGRFRQHNAYASSLSAKSRGGNWKGDGTRTSKRLRSHGHGYTAETYTYSAEQATPTPSSENGIISQAIANAHQDQDQEAPTTPIKQNTESLLARSPTQTSTPQTQFTFTCESDSSNKMLWPQHPPPAPRSPLANHSATRQQQQPTYANPPPPPQQPPQSAPPKKTRPRRPSKEFAMQERQRRLQQEYTNYHSRPAKDDMWICEFCEYEDIWGERPEALIRQYEIKDRKERQKAEERRRLLEKAKQKNRKGKKNMAKGKQAPQQPQNGAGQNYPDENTPLEGDGRQEEYEDDGYDDGYDQQDQPPDQRYPAAEYPHDRPPRAPDKQHPPPTPLQQREQ
ncbi:hypothetical protein D6C91_05655 [Aureobasidium pullulans]|uniref:Uncharacterized protein n=1 Tax=Aureobasidium pullulans TaxID=5580 RepID=A0A4S9T1D2_AURPU|nr:hypothetical protein D6C91_05655 [Aureobasidium pullulans]